MQRDGDGKGWRGGAGEGEGWRGGVKWGVEQRREEGQGRSGDVAGSENGEGMKQTESPPFLSKIFPDMPSQFRYDYLMLHCFILEVEIFPFKIIMPVKIFPNKSYSISLTFVQFVFLISAPTFRGLVLLWFLYLKKNSNGILISLIYSLSYYDFFNSVIPYEEQKNPLSLSMTNSDQSANTPPSPYSPAPSNICVTITERNRYPVKKHHYSPLGQTSASTLSKDSVVEGPWFEGPLGEPTWMPNLCAKISL